MLRLARYKLIFLLNDILIFYLSFFLSSIWVNSNSVYHFKANFLEEIALLAIYSFLCFSFIVIFQSNNLYKTNVFLEKSRHLTQLLKSLLIPLILVYVVSFALNLTFLLDTRIFFTYFTIISLILFIIFRVFTLSFFYKKFSKTDLILRKIIIIGSGKSAKMLTTKISIEEGCGVQIVGFLDDKFEKEENVLSNYKILGKIDQIESLKNNLNFNEAIIAIDNIDYDRMLEIIEIVQKANVNLRISSEIFNVVSERLFTEKLGNIPLIDANPKIPSDLSMIIKRVFDIITSFLGIIILLPLFLIIGLIIKLSSKGPVIFKQKRIGKYGKPFTFYKFRSMTIDNDSDEERKKMMIDFMKNGKRQEGEKSKIINHKRVTWIGKYLRKFSLDELPQLFNVLKGDMSLVGPRPCLEYEYDNYEEWQKKRTEVIPGCTGVWQVYGKDVSFKDSIILDLYYIYNLSPWLDLHLIFKTIPILLNGRKQK